MQTSTFSIDINATKERVWATLWNHESYREWTSVFSPGSDVKTDWQVGSTVLFGDGTGNGMISRIAGKTPNEFMSFEHLGELKDGVEDFSSDRVKQWHGAKENYYLEKKGDQTNLSVVMDIADDFKEFFDRTWPLALERLKSLAEKN